MKRHWPWAAVIGLALLLYSPGSVWAEANDATVSPGKEGLPASSMSPRSEDSAFSTADLQGTWRATYIMADTLGTGHEEYWTTEVFDSSGNVAQTEVYTRGVSTPSLVASGSLSVSSAGFVSGAYYSATGVAWYWHGGQMNTDKDMFTLVGSFQNRYVYHVVFVKVAEAGSTPQGDISFILTWTHSGSSRSEGPDIDMWVTDPDGYTLSSSRNGYGLGPTPNGGRIDHDDLGGWGDGDGGGPERAYWPTGQAPGGTYIYGVRYYQGDGAASYTLKIYFGSNLYRTETGTLTSPGGGITVGDVSY